MNNNRFFIILLSLLVAFLCVSSAAAVEEGDVNNLTMDSSSQEINIADDFQLNNDIVSDESSSIGNIGIDTNSSEDKLTANSQDVLSSKTIIVEEVEEEHQEMGAPTIQTAIDSADAGDTIVIQGHAYTHCHIIVDKQLTIISNVGTTMSPCPSNNQGSGYYGVFYVSPEASGTIIDGFTIENDIGRAGSYGILVDGASDVEIRNCTLFNTGNRDALRAVNANNLLISNITAYEAENAINIVSSQNVNVRNSTIKSSKYGIKIADSSKIMISDNNVTGNTVSGIVFSGSGSYLTVTQNDIANNRNGIDITSTDHVYILSNCIAFNENDGVYVDNDIILIEIKGNFFNQNYKWDIYNDFHVTNLLDDGNELEIIDNNYMINYGSGERDIDRPVWTQVYEYNKVIGDYNYDATNDKYVYVGEGNGEYYGHQGIMYIVYVFDINYFMHCPNTHLDLDHVWSQVGNYHLQLSEIIQVKKGIYSISIVNSKGEVATDISSVPITFYLNKAGTASTPQEGDIYRTVMMKNGTATVRFYSDEFKGSGNVITAVAPTPGTNIDSKIAKTFTVSDDNIPGSVSNTTITAYDVNTYPKSNQEFIATLCDESGKAMANQTIIFSFNSKTYNGTTDENGQAKIKIYETKEGTYVAVVSFVGDEIDYYGSNASANVVVKKIASKIISSNVYMIPKLAEYYSITLKDSSNNPIAGQKVTFKVSGKTYARTTTSKGVAKVALKFTAEKTYKITINFAGTDKYNGASKTNSIVVKYSSKTAKLITPTLTIPPKTARLYTVTLQNGDGKGISNQKVVVKINGKTYTKTTAASGQAKIKVSFDSLKTYKVSASYAGSKIYKKASSTGKIIVAKTPTVITAPTVSTLPKVSKNYIVTLKTSAGNALAKQKLTIKVDGKTYTKTTNSKGQASIRVKLTDEKTYSVTVNYAGDDINKNSKATGKIVVSKITTEIESFDRTFSNDSGQLYSIALRDASANPLANQVLSYSINGVNYTHTTDANGEIKIAVGGNSFEIRTSYAGNDKYKSASKTNTVTVLNKSGVVFVESNLPNSEIQNILDSSANGSAVEFLEGNYTDIALTVNKPLNILSSKATLTAKSGSPAFNVKASDVNISDFTIIGALYDGIIVDMARIVRISGCTIANGISQSEMSNYVENVSYLGYGILINSTNTFPGYGIHIVNSTGVSISNNEIALFESGIFVEYSSDIAIDNNTLRQNNYGIKYGFGVSNTLITNNMISDCIGLYTMDVPEGPSGYGIFLNNSAVNVTISENVIVDNHLGISLDANHSTGIVVTQNVIKDNVLEGMRFNAGYDLAQDAVEPIVTDNAIYRNAIGPSMMILGELSANPFGIYANGAFDPKDKLQLDPNWYGTNNLVTWDNDTGVVGYGTMCPRINTTGIGFNVTYSSGNYTTVFYKNGEIASNLPKFDMYATLNRGTDKQAEITFDVIDGVGTFNFDAANYFESNNNVEISIGSLINSTSRIFVLAYMLSV